MALGGKELVSAYGKISCAVLAGKQINFSAGKTMTLARKTAASRTLTVTIYDSGYEVGDWVTIACSTPRTESTRPNSDLAATLYCQQAWNPVSLTEKPLCFLNDFDLASTSTTATSLVVGTRYVIESAGTTNWTTCGATAGAAGESFTAVAAGTGTGTAKEIVNEQPGIWKIKGTNPGVSFEIDCPGAVPTGTINLPTGFIATVVRFDPSKSAGVYKVGRIGSDKTNSKYRAIFGNASTAVARPDSNYVFIPSAISVLDQAVSSGLSAAYPAYADFTATNSCEEMSFIVVG
jgi:hypothetical protein